jgi:hypothetical protein
MAGKAGGSAPEAMMCSILTSVVRVAAGALLVDPSADRIAGLGPGVSSKKTN